MQLYQVLLFCHLSAVVVWVGGMALMQLAVRPSAATLLEPAQRVAFMAATLGRFFSIAAFVIVILLISGGWMMQVMAEVQQLPVFVHVMAGLGLVMTAVFGHLRFAIFPRLRRAVAAQDWPLGGQILASIRPLVTLNLVLGVVTICVATIGRTLL